MRDDGRGARSRSRSRSSGTSATAWFFGPEGEGAAVEAASVGNLKQTWVRDGAAVDLLAVGHDEFLRHATQVKNIWVSYGA